MRFMTDTNTKTINPILKLILELGPVILFFVGYSMIKDRTFTVYGIEYSGFIAVTAGFIPVLLAASGIMWWLSGQLSRMQIVTAVLVLVFGTLSILFNDERFFKIKPTIIYVFFAGLLGYGLIRGRSYIQYVMEQALNFSPEGWMKLTRRCIVFFLCLAGANEIIWRFMSTDAWVTFKTFGVTSAIFVFFVSQSWMLRRYMQSRS